ncbi:hypothetical protein HRbin26_01490 [bacterium HR26]|nr:hypothetical protein HRbin26_01490 [bacterium HR26]
MAEHVEAGAGRHHRRAGNGIERVDDGERGADIAVGDAGLHLELQEIEHDDSRRLAAGTGRRRESDVRLQRTRYRLSLADRLVDVVHQLARMGGKEVHRLGGVDGAAPAQRDERLRLRLPGIGDRVVHRAVGRLHVDVVVHVELDPSIADDPLQFLDQAELPQVPIGHQQGAADAEPVQLVAQLPRGAEPEADGHAVERDDGLGRDEAIVRHGASPFLAGSARAATGRTRPVSRGVA